MKKRITSIILFIILAFSSLCSAQTIDYFLYEGPDATGEEITEMKNYIINEKSSIIGSLDSFDFAGANKIYSFKDSDIVSLYKKTGNIEDMISDRYSWLLPKKNYEVIAMYKSKNGLKYSYGAICETLEKFKKTIVIKEDIINTLKDANITDIQNCKILTNSSYATLFVYVKSNNTEWLIPVSERPDFTGLENGKLYEPQQVMDTLYENLGDYYIDPPENGEILIGTFGHAYKTINYTAAAVIIISAFSLLILFSLILHFLHRKV